MQTDSSSWLETEIAADEALSTTLDMTAATKNPAPTSTHGVEAQFIDRLKILRKLAPTIARHRSARKLIAMFFAASESLPIYIFYHSRTVE